MCRTHRRRWISWCLILGDALCFNWPWRCSMFTIYAKLKPVFSECLPGWMAAGSGAAVSSIRLVFFPFWHVVLPWRLPPVRSRHLPAGRAGEPPALVHVPEAMLMGHRRLPFRMAARSDLEKDLRDALRDSVDIIASCITCEGKHHLKDYVPSRCESL